MHLSQLSPSLPKGQCLLQKVRSSKLHLNLILPACPAPPSQPGSSPVHPRPNHHNHHHHHNHRGTDHHKDPRDNSSSHRGCPDNHGGSDNLRATDVHHPKTCGHHQHPSHPRSTREGGAGCWDHENPRLRAPSTSSPSRPRVRQVGGVVRQAESCS